MQKKSTTKKRKSFAIWKFYVKKKKFHIAKHTIGKNLMYLDPTLSIMYFHIVATCEALRKLEIIKIEKHKIYDMSEFRQSQEQLRATALEKKTKLISELVHFVCVCGEKEIFKAIGIDTKIRKNALDIVPAFDPSQSFLTIEPPHSHDSINATFSNIRNRQPISSTNKSGSLLSLTFSDKSVVRQVCRRLSELLRLADFMLRDAIYEV